MSAATKGGWVVAASIGAVEALKDQLGVCRWNYVIRSIEQRAKTRVQSYYQTHVISPPPAAAGSGSSAGRMMRMMGAERERREICVKKVMDLSCWGPTTVRFWSPRMVDRWWRRCKGLRFCGEFTCLARCWDV